VGLGSEVAARARRGPAEGDKPAAVVEKDRLTAEGATSQQALARALTESGVGRLGSAQEIYDHPPELSIHPANDADGLQAWS
jgi:hypothetical protein